MFQANQHIRMISKGSCDTEDLSNDAENSALITGINLILKYIQIESSYKKCWVVSTQIWVKYEKPKCWVKNVQLRVKVEVGFKF